MKITLILMTWLAMVFPLNGQSFFEANAKKISKELSQWSSSYSRVVHQKDSEGREFYHVIDHNDSTFAKLVLTSAQGRFERFDLMVVMNVEAEIVLIRILRYRSEFGSEISNKKWLAQFYSHPDSIFIFRKNIDAISGATYSTQGLIDEINKIRSMLDS